MVYQNMVTPGAAESQSTVSAGLQIGLGTKSAATEVINTQGALNETDNPLDVAIQGTGFFQVQRPDGTIGYTRAGQFHLNNQGTIVTTDGDLTVLGRVLEATRANIGVMSQLQKSRQSRLEYAPEEGSALLQPETNNGNH
jgi:flagellar basal-body rod protein FlgG